MEERILDQNLSSDSNKQPRRLLFPRLLALALLLSLALSFYPALNYLVPRGLGREQGVTDRLTWYIQSGQSRADIRTLASVFRFVMETDSDAGTAEVYSTMPIAENASASSPKS